MYKVNFKLKFEISGGSSSPTSFDPITGEPIFNTTEQVVEASLEQGGNMAEEILQGTDEAKTYVVGRCINPKNLTDQQRKKQKVNCEMLINNDWYPAKLEIKPKPASRLGLESFFNELVEGYVSIDI